MKSKRGSNTTVSKRINVIMFMTFSGSIWDMMESTNPLDFDFGYANGEYCPQICDVHFSNYANYGCSCGDY